MSIKVTFPEGANGATSNSLYQWDYGQILEIESADIGTEIVEVHFACLNMSEAIVRSCSFSNGVGSVTIPDTCLEQTTLITAWIYRISGSEGHTIKTITIPIISRTRPSAKRDIPNEVADKYTELLTEVNKAVENLEKGNVTIANAVNAANANHATSAGNSANANYAVSAGSATTAGTASKALMDSNERTFLGSYLHESNSVDRGSPVNGVPLMGGNFSKISGGCYILATLKAPMCDICFGVVRYDGSADVNSTTAVMGASEHLQLWISENKAYVNAVNSSGLPQDFPYPTAILELRYLNNVYVAKE